MTPADIANVVSKGDSPSHAVLGGMTSDERRLAIELLIQTPAGRAWLRRGPNLDGGTADVLLEFEGDFRQTRRDVSLTRVVESASLESLVQHARAIASGPAASVLWSRLAEHHATLIATAMKIVRSGDAVAADSTLVHLVLDPVNSFGLADEERGRIAIAALHSGEETIRGVAAEYVLSRDPAVLLQSFDEYVRDTSERVRGVTWIAALQLARADATELAMELILNEDEGLEVRRSALIAAGTHLPTSDLVDILAILVVHPDAQLAGDAAELLYRNHRHPVVAEAARHSPHESVRQIAEFLLDPFRGSPAAGGSRPGDPTRSATAEIFSDMIKQIEERARNS